MPGFALRASTNSGMLRVERLFATASVSTIFVVEGDRLQIVLDIVRKFVDQERGDRFWARTSGAAT